MLFSYSESDAILVGSDRDLALPLGIGCWILALFVVRVAWSRWPGFVAGATANGWQVKPPPAA